MDFRIALTGNPNVGKTSLFNRLTRSFEHVGNWHGVTVKKVGKRISFGGKNVVIDDLPGLYSLSVYSYEEGIARDCVYSEGYDAIINICEVNNLQRNLYLTLQLIELDVPVVLVVNMVDELSKRGLALNAEKLQAALQIPVIPLSAKYKIDTGKLISTCESYARTFKGNKLRLNYLDELPISELSSLYLESIKKAALKPTYAAIKLLENDEFIREKLGLKDVPFKADSKANQARVAALRYQFIDEITKDVIVKLKQSVDKESHRPSANPLNSQQNTNQLEHSQQSANPAKRNKQRTNQLEYSQQSANPAERNKQRTNQLEYSNQSTNPAENGGALIIGRNKTPSKMYLQYAGKIDKIALNKYLALPIFLGVMALIFVITFGLLGKWLSSGLEFIMEKALYEPITNGLKSVGAWDWFTALIGEGIINGVGGILVFLPQIVLLFFFLALLEDSGYISRVAFMTDGIFRKIGLSGRSAFTMLMGFGCSATAVLTSRGLEDDNMRKKTVLLTPFMSCSARLPVYSAIGAAFFLGSNALVIFALYFLGAVVAFILAAVLEKTKKFKSGKLSFIMEMPPYRLPTLERVRQLIWNNSKVFIIRVGTVIFGLNVIVWMLSNFSIYGYTAGTDYASFLETLSGLIAPIFAPLGFGNWEAVTSLLSGLVAKESVLATIESLGGMDVILKGQNSVLSALCFLVFTLLYVPCIATLSAIAKEIGYKYAIISFVLQITVAYVVALIVRLIGLLFISNLPLAIGVLLGGIILVAVALSIAYSIKNRGCKNCSGCNHKQRLDCDKSSGKD